LRARWSGAGGGRPPRGGWLCARVASAAARNGQRVLAAREGKGILWEWLPQPINQADPCEAIQKPWCDGGDTDRIVRRGCVRVFAVLGGFVRHTAAGRGWVGRCRSWPRYGRVRLCDQPAGGSTSRKERHDLWRGAVELVARHREHARRLAGHLAGVDVLGAKSADCGAAVATAGAGATARSLRSSVCGVRVFASWPCRGPGVPGMRPHAAGDLSNVRGWGWPARFGAERGGTSRATIGDYE